MAVKTFIRIFGCCVLGLLVFGLGFVAVAVGIIENISGLAFLGPVLGLVGAVLMFLGWLMFQSLHDQLQVPAHPQ